MLDEDFCEFTIRLFHDSDEQMIHAHQFIPERLALDRLRLAHHVLRSRCDEDLALPTSRMADT